jgi:hypothetical protein
VVANENYWDWVFGFGDCLRGKTETLALWKHGGPRWLVQFQDIQACAANHFDIALALPLAIYLLLFFLRRFRWIGIESREIAFFVICWGVWLAYFVVFWRFDAGSLLTVLAALLFFAAPTTAAFVVGAVRSFSLRAHPKVSTPLLVIVIALVLLGHGCMHYISFAGLGS